MNTMNCEFCGTIIWLDLHPTCCSACGAPILLNKPAPKKQYNTYWEPYDMPASTGWKGKREDLYLRDLRVGKSLWIPPWLWNFKDNEPMSDSITGHTEMFGTCELQITKTHSGYSWYWPPNERAIYESRHPKEWEYGFMPKSVESKKKHWFDSMPW